MTPNTSASCDDANACSYDDTCNGSGQCVGTAITCTPTRRSSDITYVTGTGCTFTANTAPCDDANACTYDDTCNGSGQCVGTTITCTSDTCNARSCNGTSSCTVTANRGAPCGGGGSCDSSGTCVTPTATTSSSTSQ